MKIFNTLTRQKEAFKPMDPQEVKIYACGPTVYNFIHIGNARPLCVFDVLRRYLEYRGYVVKFVKNFTAIYDKIIKRANEEGKTYQEISETILRSFGRTPRASMCGRLPCTPEPRKTLTRSLILSAP